MKKYRKYAGVLTLVLLVSLVLTGCSGVISILALLLMAEFMVGSSNISVYQFKESCSQLVMLLAELMELVGQS